MAKKREDITLLGTENIVKLLTQYSIPAIIGMTAASLYNLADSIFIGHGVGPLAISAMAITLPIINITVAFGAMVGVGSSTLLSVKLGQKDYDSARQILGNVVILNTIIGIIISAIVLLFLDKILVAFGASEANIGYARDYMRILIAGNTLTHLYMGLNDIIRASGYPAKAMGVTITAVVVNCILNAIFIFVLDMGIKGAAWATVLAQLVALSVEVRHFANKQSFIHYKRELFILKKSIVKGIFSIGVSPLLMNLCASLVVITLNRGLASHGGDMAVGAYGIVNRVAMFFVMITFGLNQGMQPIVGYNYGAGKVDRMLTTFKYTVFAGCGVLTMAFLLSLLLPEQVAKMFTTDPELLHQTEKALRIVFSVFPIVGFQIVTCSFFQSIGMAWKAIFLSLSRQMIFLIPMLLVFQGVWGLDGIWASLPASDLLAVITAAVMLYYQLKKFKKMS